jgi:hypothetical protein
LRREGGLLDRLAHRADRCVPRSRWRIDGLDALLRQAAGYAAALEAISEQADLANRSMKTTLVDVLYRRGVSLVLARRLTQRLWDAAGLNDAVPPVAKKSAPTARRFV